ncbi:DNA double-strand break repair protein Mre11 [Halobellus clavatus]|uniref:DNA double-strand break repair protein Mre11 n=1 Tax=Halobellus clavatus TaxID=660517 RepID=UPI000B015D67|nr:DNA double-strand break repair protein Mre11 [Halobellus clavatus]
MTRVIHTGDTHLGYQQYHSPERRADFLDAFEQVIDDAIETDVDAVVHAGDLFHDRRPDLRDLLGTIRVLRRLRDADVPFLAVVGNHEATRGGQWLDLFENLDLAERLGDAPRTVGDTAFYGLDHVPKSRRADLDYDFQAHDAAHAVLVGHGLFTPFAHANWETETVLEQSNVDFDALLLGDNHAPGTEVVDDTWVTYCGSTERASAAEEEPRGYNLVTFDESVDVRRRTLDTRPFVFVSVELAEDEGVERVHEQLRQRDVTDAVVVVEVTGAGDPVTPAAVEEALTERGALIARVTDRREQDHEASIDVSFADPDAAVDERVRELGLSAAALDVEGTIRADGIPDTTVRETVESHVSELLEDDADAFAPAADPSADDSADDVGESTATDAADHAVDTDELDDADDEDEIEGANDADETEETTDEDETADANDADEPEGLNDEDETADANETDDAPGSATDETTPADTQVTMEDF